jgi:TrkA-N domain/RyR domain
MFKTRDFLPIIVTAIIVFGLAVAAVIESGVCRGDGACFVVSPLEILFGQPPAGVHSSPVLLALALFGVKFVLPMGAFLSSVRIVLTAVKHDFRAVLARRQKNHIIVCGLGDTGMRIVRNMRSEGKTVVVVDRSEDAANLAACDQLKIAVIKGDAINPEALSLAGVGKADAVIACTGNDVSNVNVALQLKELFETRRRLTPIKVIAEVRSPWLFSRLESHNRGALGSDSVELRLFNTSENAARLLLRAFRFPPGPEIQPGAFAIFGFGSFGLQVALHMLRSLPVGTSDKVKIVVVDQAADECQRRFRQNFPAASKFADVQFVTANISPATPEGWDTVESTLFNTPLLGAAICFEQDQAGLYAALGVRRRLDDRFRIETPIFLRLAGGARLKELSAAIENFEGQPGRFQLFAGNDEVLGFDVLVKDELDSLARALHEQYRNTQFPPNHTASNLPWSQLPEALKIANRRRADNIPFVLSRAGLELVPSSSPDCIELDDREIERLAELEHRRWIIERELLGYSYGEVRSEFPPRHDLLTDWEELPEAVRQFNRDDARRLPSLLAHLNWEIRRQEKVLAVGEGLSTAQSRLNSIVSEPRGGVVVVADIDTPEGRAVAERTLDLPKTQLWLLSSNAPADNRDFQQLGATAAGWITRQQFRPLPKPGT